MSAKFRRSVLLRSGLTSVAIALAILIAPPSVSARVLRVPCSGSDGGASGLVRAIAKADAAFLGPDTIELAPGCVYVLHTVNNNWYGPNGLPPIASPLSIEGNGAVIARSTASGTPAFRFFYVGANSDGPYTNGYTRPGTGAGRLALRDVTLTGGLAHGGNSHGGGGGAGLGGAIFSQGGVTLERTTLVGDIARGGFSFTGAARGAYGDGGGGLRGNSSPAGDGTPSTRRGGGVRGAV